MKKWLLSLSLVLTLSTSIFAADKLGDKAPALTDFDVINVPAQFKDADFGKTGKIEFKKGTAYIVEFWATWCGPCVRVFPHLSEIQKKYGDKLVVIGVSVDAPNTAGRVKQFATDPAKKMNYRIIHSIKNTNSVAYLSAFKQPGIPSAFLVDQEGKIVWVGHPSMGLDEALAKILPATATPTTEAIPAAKLVPATKVTAPEATIPATKIEAKKATKCGCNCGSSK